MNDSGVTTAICASPDMASAYAEGVNSAAKANPKPNLAARNDFAPRIRFFLVVAAIRIGNCLGLTESMNFFTFAIDEG